MNAFEEKPVFELSSNWSHEHQDDEAIETGGQTGVEPNTALHPMVSYLVFGIFMVMLAAYLLRFLHDSYTTFMVSISIGYFLIYFGVPYVMLRDRDAEGTCDQSFTVFLRKPFATNTGIISGFEATMQACLIPAAITVCTIGICFVM